MVLLYVSLKGFTGQTHCRKTDRKRQIRLEITAVESLFDIDE